jgi:acyl-CoA dehydrogenase
MDFSLSPELTELQQRTRQFIRQEIIPMESDTRQTPHGPSQALRDELIAKGRAAGLLTPHASKALGGLGLSHVAKSIVFEEAGYSPLGPVALNIHAPDEGNIHLLEAIANEAQRERWLKPLVAGRIRSCFAMTEPAPGAGSDPSMLQTSAVPDGNAYRITGQKWFITGADGAAFTIVMARMLDGSASMFLADMKQPGIELERQMDSLDSCFTGGHGVLSFENLRVPATDVLGEIGQGFRYAQVRLAPARLTHCMRWLGQARRAHDVAVRYATQRRSFGKSLVEHEGVGFMLADNEMDLYAARLAIWHTAWVLDQSLADPGLGGHESSVTKVMVSEATWRIVDRAVQVLGGQGVTAETIVARIFRDLRAFRIYDGPSEVHRWSIAKRIAKRANDAP